MSADHASAVRSTLHPASRGRSLNPYPGSDGHTMWNASAGSPPCAAGSASGSITLSNSTIEPGHPWVRTSGRAPSCGDRTWMKWMPSPSISVRNWGSRLRRASVARQSYSSAQ